MSWPSIPSVPSVWHTPAQPGAQAPAVNMNLNMNMSMYQQYAMQQQSWEQWQIYQTQLAQWQAQYGEQVRYFIKCGSFNADKFDNFSFFTVPTNAKPEYKSTECSGWICSATTIARLSATPTTATGTNNAATRNIRTRSVGNACTNAEFTAVACSTTGAAIGAKFVENGWAINYYNAH